MDAHSYTTVSVTADGAARITVSLCPDEFAPVLCPRGKDHALISVSHARADVVICPSDSSAPTAADARFARRLAESFTAYAAEVERLHVETGAAESTENPAT